MKRTSKVLALATTLILFAGAAFANGGKNAKVRFVHASPDAPAVDIWVNGGVAFPELIFGEVSPYASVPAGLYDVQVVPAGATSPVVIDLTGENAVNLFYNRAYTAIALNTLANIEPLLLQDDDTPAPMPFARVRFVHASPDAPAVDVAVVGGPFLFENVAFKGVGDYVQVPAGTYNLEVRVAGTSTVALPLPAVKLDGGTTYTVYAIGFAGGAAPALTAAVSVDRENPARLKAQRAR
jgi:hypothetical protein